MVDKITVTNTSTGISTIIDRGEANFWLTDDEGVDWGETASTLSTQAFIDGIGSELVNLSITTARNITITGWARGDETPLSEKRRLLDRLFNPSDTVEIACGDYKISGKPSHSVKYAIDPGYNNESFCKWSVQISCVFPFFTKEKIYQAGYGTDTPLMPSESGSVMIPVRNSGSFPVGAEFKLSFFGSSFIGKTLYVLVNSSNLTFSEKFKLLNVSGDVITVSTVPGKRSVKKDDELALSLWDMGSDWAKIPQEYSNNNSSVYIYTEDGGGNFGEFAVRIKFNELYLSVEEA